MEKLGAKTQITIGTGILLLVGVITAINAPSAATTIDLTIPKADVTVSTANVTTIQANGKRTYAKFCNNNLQTPPVYFYIRIQDSDAAIELPQGQCYEDNSKEVSKNIDVFASTSQPSVLPAVLNATMDN